MSATAIPARLAYRKPTFWLDRRFFARSFDSPKAMLKEFCVPAAGQPRQSIVQADNAFADRIPNEVGLGVEAQLTH